MVSYLNTNRPPVYCPGCTHEQVASALDKALGKLNSSPDKIVIVSDIGCSGLFDTFFNVHALHGLHGRALTYATGLKMARPEIDVIVTMGDGGMGIGGAHLLAACRRNLDLTLIVMNNFNFGMTGGQCSVTTPEDAVTGSGFLNQAEIPVDVCGVAESAGATFVSRCSGLDDELAEKLVQGIQHKGFSVIETLGICTGRYTKGNKLNPSVLERMVDELPEKTGLVEQNARAEYGERYRELSRQSPTPPEPVKVECQVELSGYRRQEVALLGSAGMRIVTAGELLCNAGLTAGLNVTQKNDYNITVLRGQSVAEVILSPEPIGYTGSTRPTLILALSDEGVRQRTKIFGELSGDVLVVKEQSVTLPDTDAEVVEIDFTALKIGRQDWALAALCILAQKERVIKWQMLELALAARFRDKALKGAMRVMEKIRAAQS